MVKISHRFKLKTIGAHQMKVLNAVTKCKYLIVLAILALAIQIQLAGHMQAFAGIGEQPESSSNGLNDQYSVYEQRGYSTELFEVEYAIGGNSASADSVSDHELKINPNLNLDGKTNSPHPSQNTPEPLQIASGTDPMLTFVGLGKTGDTNEEKYPKIQSTMETPNAVNFDGTIYYLMHIPSTATPNFTINFNISERENGDFITTETEGDSTLNLITAQDWQTVPGVLLNENKTYILGIFNVVSDLVDEADGLITFTLLPGSGYRISDTESDNKATLSVTDNDLPIVSISGPTSMDENSNVVYTVTTATGKVFADLTVNVNISQNPNVTDQLLYASADMMGNQTQTVSFLASEATATKAITITTNDESGGSITASLAASTNGTYHLAQKRTQVTSIIDTNAPVPTGPVIELMPVTTDTIIEGEIANFNFQVASGSTVTTELEVNLEIVDSGNFIKGTLTNTVTIETNGAGMKPVPTDDDGSDEADGIITVTILPGSLTPDNKNYQLSETSAKISQTITVQDNDIPRVSISRTVGHTEEDTPNLNYRLSASPPPYQMITISLTITAPDGLINSATARSIVLSPTDATSKQGTILLLNSDEFEDIRTITIQIASGTGYAPVGNSTLNADITNTITIAVLDSDYKPKVTLEGASTRNVISESNFIKNFTISEDANEINGPVQFYVSMHAPDYTEADFIVNYQVSERANDNFLNEESEGSMMLDLDSFEVANTNNRYYFTVVLFIVSDLIDEPDGEITFTVLEGDDYIISDVVEENSIKIIVEDNDEPPIFSIVGPADGVAETGTAEFMVIAKDNTGRIIDPGAEIEIFYTVTDDPNGDFIAMEDEGPASTVPAVSFTKNSRNQYTAPIRISLDDDMTAERTGTISVTLTADENAANGIASYTVATAPDNQATATIWDNDAPELTITGGDPVIEGTPVSDGQPQPPVSMAIYTLHSRVEVPGGTRTIYYTPVSPEGANFIADSGIQTSQARTFADDDNDGIYTATIEIPIVADAVPELSGNVIVTLNDDVIDTMADPEATFTYTVGTPNSASVFVRDDDLTELTIAAANDETVTENTGATAKFIITASQMPPAEGLAIRYTPISTSFLAEEVSGITVTANPPIIFTTTRTQDNELYTAQLSIPVDVDSEFDFPGMIEVRLEPDQSTPLTYNVGLNSTASVSVVEGGRFASYTLSITADGTKQVEAGNLATFTISSSTQINNESFPVFIEVTGTESFIAWRIPNSIRMSQNSYRLKIQTIANDETEPGSITVTLIPKFESYGINVDQYEDTIIVTNPTSDDGSEPTPEARISVADVVVNKLLDLINPQPDTPAPSQSEASPEFIRPTVSISAVNDVVDEGDPIELVVLSQNGSIVNNFMVALQITRGTNLVEGPAHQNIQLNGSSAVPITIPTKNDNRASDDGVVEVTLLESENYSISANQKQNEVIITISDETDRQNRLEEITAHAQAFVPELTGTLGANSLATISNRIELGFKESGNQTLELGGQNSLTGMVTASGEAINENSTTLKSLLGDSSFAMSLISGDDFAIPTTFWGLGAYQNISSSEYNQNIDWSGDLFTGQIGIDALVQEGLLVGISASVAESEVEFETSDPHAIAFNSNTTSLNPYLGWTSKNQNSKLHATLGLGRGELEIKQKSYDNEILDSTSYSFGLTGKQVLFTSDQILPGATKLTIEGDSWFAYRHIIGSDGILADFHTTTQHVQINTKGSHQFDFATGSTLRPHVSIGLRSDTKDNQSFEALALTSGVDYRHPIGILVDGNSNMLIGSASQVHKMVVKSSLNYDLENDERGFILEIAPSWQQVDASIQDTIWNSNELDSSFERNHYFNGSSVSGELSYGLEILQRNGVLTPLSGFKVSANQDYEYLVGTRLELGPNTHFSMTGFQGYDSAGRNSAKVQLEGRLNW